MFKNKNIFKKFLYVSIVVFTVVLFNGCAVEKIYLNKITAPPQTNKLRVALIAISEPFFTSAHGLRFSYQLSYEEFKKNQYIKTKIFLDRLGMYEVIPEEDVRAVIGNQVLTRQQLQENNWMLAKQIAANLYANYVMLVERGSEGPARFVWKMDMINADSAKVFSVHEEIPGRGYQDDFIKTIPIAYMKLFTEAKADLLATAIKKATLTTPAPNVLPQSIPSSKTKEKPETKTLPQIPQEITERSKDLAVKSDQSKHEIPQVEEKKTFKQATEKRVPDRTRVVIYDFDAESNLRVVALILTEALREELYNIGRFELVNREDLSKVTQEIKLKESGLVDEKEAVTIGSFLGAKESITGRLNSLGNLYIISAKRTDIQTLKTKSLGSIRCSKGNEEELLNSMPLLAKKLMDER